MGRAVIAEEGILPNLLSLARPDCYEVGLIIGQNTGQRDYVIHLARTPRPANKAETEELLPEDGYKVKTADHVIIKSVKDIQEHWIADHAKHVTRMLPGGVGILGVFTVGPGDVFSDTSGLRQLRQVLVRIRKHLATNRFLFGDGPSADKLLLHLDSSTRKYTSKVFNTETTTPSSGAPVDWKFQTAPGKWHQIGCQFELDQFFPVTEGKVAQPIKQSLQDILCSVAETVQASTCLIEGRVASSTDSLDSVDWSGESQRTKGKKGPLTLSASLFLPCSQSSSENEDEMQLLPCGASMYIYGTLASRVFLHEKATVGEAIQALKEDIIRSMAARLELHWDSLIEEEQGSPEERMVLHEPPRRVLVPLPHCRVALSDYLFPGEGPSEALVSLQELLDLDMTEDDVQKDLEQQADPTEFCPPEVEAEVSEVSSTASSSKIRARSSSSHHQQKQQQQQQTNVLLGGLIAAAAILVLSISVQLTGWFDQV